LALFVFGILSIDILRMMRYKLDNGVQVTECLGVGVTKFDEMADGRMPVGGGFTR
jgi:hypothetical protein